MKKKTKISLGVCVLIIGILSVTSTDASPIEHKFKSPSFSGINQSSHYLTIENIEKTRRDAIEAQKKADAKALKAEDERTSSVLSFDD